MRSVAQSLLARHPALAGVGVGCRWVAWAAVGHPFGLLLFALALGAGLRWWPSAIVGAGAEAVVGLWGVVGLTTGAQSLQLWAQLCRFRRRWPGRFSRAYRSEGHPPVVVSNLYSVPGGLRPVLAAPRLSVMPHAFDHQTIGWHLLPRADHDLMQVALAVGRVGGSDESVGAISLRSLPGGDLALIVRFRRFAVRRSTQASRALGSLVIDEGGGSAIDPWDDQDLLHSLALSDVGGGSNGRDHVVRLGDLPGSGADSVGGRETSASRPPERRLGRVEPAHSNAGRQSIGSGHFVSHLPPSATDQGRRRRSRMRWSFSVVLPANVLVGVAVAASDAGRVGLVAVCVAAVLSILLIVAEGAVHR